MSVDNLFNNGYIVIPLFSGKTLSNIEKLFDITVSKFPEYKDSSEPILSSFGALGNPSSFHNPLVRILRRKQFDTAKELFKANNKYSRLEILFDRLGKREIGKTISGESWHRDQAPKESLELGDIVLGGWINLNSKGSQYFVCAPKTHTEKEEKEGFVKFTPEQIEILKTKEKKIEIPPGHWILFFQNIGHKIKSGKIKEVQRRLFTGVRLTNSSVPLYDQKEAILKQGVPIIPGGMIPKMVEKNHLSFWQDKCQTWSLKSFPEKCLRTTKSGNLIVHSPMHSLTEYEFPLYPAYSTKDLSILKPTLI